MSSSQFDSWLASEQDQDIRDTMADVIPDDVDAMFRDPAFIADMERRAAYANSEAA
jgi:hypothetical protein